MGEFLARLLEFIAIVWLVRFVLHNVLGGVKVRTFSQGGEPPQANRSQGPPVISGEMKKDPQCGMYVSTELSVKSRYGGETLHFCSHECEEQFLQAHSTKPA